MVPDGDAQTKKRGSPDEGETRPGEAPRSGALAEEPLQSGWRSQPLALKLLLIASLVALTVGVVRCSYEVTPPVTPVLERIMVARASVRIRPGLLAAPADTVAAQAARRVSAALGVPILSESIPHDEVGEYADALIFVVIGGGDEVVEVAAEVKDVVSSAVLAEARATGPPAAVYDVLDLAILELAVELEKVRGDSVQANVTGGAGRQAGADLTVHDATPTGSGE
jgi:hypothetical protein